MYFLRGSLPWQGLKIHDKENRYKKICEKKKSTSAKDLCAGFPLELETFVQYTRELQFTQLPDYEYLRQLLKKILKDQNETIDYYFDWFKEKPNILANDMIYTNNYGIVYDGKHDWLNRKKNDKNNNEQESLDNQSNSTNFTIFDKLLNQK